MPGDRPGERRAAQPSGRPHEPSGDRRPEMDGHHRTALRRRSVQNSAYRPRSLTHPYFVRKRALGAVSVEGSAHNPAQDGRHSAPVGRVTLARGGTAGTAESRT